MKKLIPLKEFKYEIGSLSLMVEHFISSDMKNVVEFLLNGKSIWNNNYQNYMLAEARFILIKNILKALKAKSINIKTEDITPEKLKEISREFLLEFKKIK